MRRWEIKWCNHFEGHGMRWWVWNTYLHVNTCIYQETLHLFVQRRNGKERLQRRQWWSSCVPGRWWQVVPGGNWIEKIKQLIFFAKNQHQHCPFVIKAGIVSFGPSPCDTHIPSVFTRVAGFRLFKFSKTTTFDQALIALPDSKFLIILWLSCFRDWIEKTVEQNGGWE